MGASTVLMAAGKPMHPRVKGVLADCGFTTAKDIIYKCARQMKLKFVNREVRLKFTPQLRFVLDHSLEKGDETLAIISQLEANGQA